MRKGNFVMMNLDIIVLLIVVALIFQRLWKALGTRPEEEPKKIRLSREGAEKLYNLLRSETEKGIKEAAKTADVLTPVNSEPLSELDSVLQKIPGFNKTSFLKGAKKAFQVITEAFNKADAETLKMLVSNSVYKKLQEIIKQRQTDKMTAETDFICFDKAEIINAKIDGKDKAVISVEFVSEQINVLRDKDNNIVQGDENYIQTITDIWTFERPLDAKTLNWVLVSTKK